MRLAPHPMLTLPLCSFLLLGCSQAALTQAATEVNASPPAAQHFVSADYAQRAQGHDWMAVTVAEESPERIAVSVRSRHDQKKPSCTLDAYAKKIDVGAYQAMVKGQPINFTLSAQELVISAPNPEALQQLAYYCSGGASLNGSYQKIDGSLDAQQLDPSPFKPEPAVH